MWEIEKMKNIYEIDQKIEKQVGVKDMFGIEGEGISRNLWVFLKKTWRVRSSC